MSTYFTPAIKASLAITAVLAFTALCGCETDSASSEVKIVPESISVRKGQNVTFTASGGYEYSWALSDNTLGVLSKRTGHSTTYTSLSEPASNAAPVVQIITVTSTIGSGQQVSTTVGTNGLPISTTTPSGYSVKGQAFVTHMPAIPIPTKTPRVPQLYVEPPDSTIGYGQSITLTASGSSSYSWSLETEKLGTLTPRQGPVVTYTSMLKPASNETGVVAIQKVVVSSGGTNYTAVIKHVAP